MHQRLPPGIRAPEPARGRSRGLAPAQALSLALLSLVTAACAVFVVGAAFALRDAAPEGPACLFEAEEGSGPAGYGREELRWSWFPTTYCRGRVQQKGSPARLIEDPIAPSSSSRLGIIVLGCGPGLAVWLVGRGLLLRRRVADPTDAPARAALAP